jgi:hypothetical protein
MSVHRSLVPVLLGLLVLAFPLDAWAYLDVGTGSYLFQLAIAGFFAGLMTIKLYYQRVMMWFQARRHSASAPAELPTSKSSGTTQT